MNVSDTDRTTTLAPSSINGDSVILVYSTSHVIINKDSKNPHVPKIIKMVLLVRLIVLQSIDCVWAGVVVPPSAFRR